MNISKWLSASPLPTLRTAAGQKKKKQAKHTSHFSSFITRPLRTILMFIVDHSEYCAE